MICGGGSAMEFPDLGVDSLGCCWGTTIRGPEDCTCWEPEYELEQTEPRPEIMPMPRAKMCDDCAFRPNSPERLGDETYEHSHGLDDLSELVDKGEPFYCHQGMRLPVRWRHPSGAIIDGHPGDYSPPIQTVNGVSIPFKADGTPGDICAGWWARFQRNAAS